MEKACWSLGDLPAHGHLCQLQLLWLHCHDQGGRHCIPRRLHEGDPELGRVSEMEDCLPASTGWIQCAGLQVLMINNSFSSKTLLDTPSSDSRCFCHTTYLLCFFRPFHQFREPSDFISCLLLQCKLHNFEGGTRTTPSLP